MSQEQKERKPRRSPAEIMASINASIKGHEQAIIKLTAKREAIIEKLQEQAQNLLRLARGEEVGE